MADVAANNDFVLNYPTTIMFGDDRIETLADHLVGFDRVLLVMGGHAEKTGLRNRLVHLLAGKQVSEVVGVSPEPELNETRRLVDHARRGRCEAVVAVGGGSVIDASKAAAALAPRAGDVRDYFYGERTIPGKGLFFIAAPTTAGTGAEITRNAVLTDGETLVKQSIRHPSMTADVAIVDPMLTLSAPPALTAASGLDALTQAVESFTTQKANHATRALALHAVRLLVGNLPGVHANPDNLELRRLVAEGSLLSAMAFSQSGLGAAHGLAHPIGALLKVPHGVACSILLSPVARWNMAAADLDYQTLAQACGRRNAVDFVAVIEDLRVKLNMPSAFTEYGLTRRHFPFIVKHCRSNSMKGNPRPMTDQDVIDMLEILL